MMRLFATIFALAVTTCLLARPAWSQEAAPAASIVIGGLTGDAARGATLYPARCGGCHAVATNRVGPRHQGVVGRRAGSVEGFSYSPALKASEVVWTPENLDRWLTNPQEFIPGQRMGFRLSQPQDRADIIAYLATQK